MAATATAWAYLPGRPRSSSNHKTQFGPLNGSGSRSMVSSTSVVVKG